MRLRIDLTAETARQTAPDPVFRWIEVALDWIEEDPVNDRAKEIEYAEPPLWAIEAVFTDAVWVVLWEVATDADGEHAHVVFIGQWDPKNLRSTAP